jgi:Disulphide bond corrector protein DsbC
MKRTIAAVLLSAACSLTAIAAPMKPPVQWRIKSSPTKPLKPGAKFSVTITGDLDPGWHLYALEEPEGGPVATEIALTDGDPADLIRVEEAKPKVLPDPLFQKPTGFFEHSAAFTLHLQAANSAVAASTALRVLIRYQSCNDRICLPPHTDTVNVPLTLAR